MQGAISRRGLLHVTAAASALALLPHAPAFAKAGAGTALSADEALALLKKGNADFVADRVGKQPNAGPTRRLALAEKQTPFCAILGCADSRVPPELLFARGLGELFVVRVAGNVFDQASLGSIEYAVAMLGVPLIVVLGHENCGAVKAAIDVVENGTILPGSLNEVVEPIVPAVLAAQRSKGDLLKGAIRENVRRVEARLAGSEPIIAAPIARGKVGLVGAVADLATGRVEFLV